MAKTVCVTGASGFIASHVVKQLLEKGYHVKATVRDKDNEDKYGWVKKLVEGTSGTIELFSADLLKPDSFDDAVAGCDYVCHTAAVVTLNSKDPKKEVVDPALDGTRNVFNSILKAKVAKRVVLTSSVAAITDKESGKTYTEEDWHHEMSLKNPYAMGKTLSERHAWKAYEDQKEKASKEGEGAWSFDLVSINPALVVGKMLHPSHHTSSMSSVKQLMDGSMPMAPDLHWSLVDVGDVAAAHVRALEKEEAKGRYIIAHGDLLSMLDIANVIRKEYPKSKVPKMVMPTALLYAVALVNPTISVDFVQRRAGVKQYFNNKKARTDLELNFVSPQQAILDAAASLIEHGVVPRPAEEVKPAAATGEAAATGGAAATTEAAAPASGGSSLQFQLPQQLLQPYNYVTGLFTKKTETEKEPEAKSEEIKEGEEKSPQPVISEERKAPASAEETVKVTEEKQEAQKDAVLEATK